MGTRNCPSRATIASILRRTRADVGLSKPCTAGGQNSFAQHAERAIDAHRRDVRALKLRDEPPRAAACIKEHLPWFQPQMAQLGRREILLADGETLMGRGANAQLGGVVVLVVEIPGVSCRMRHAQYPRV